MDDRTTERDRRSRSGANTSDYVVSYGKPPRHSQFKPGQSGNPRGRPKGSKSTGNQLPKPKDERMKTVVMEEVYREISVRDGDHVVEMPVIQAIIRNVVLNAAKGHQKSQLMIVALLQWVEGEARALDNELIKTTIEYKVWWEQELYRREKLGVTGQEPLPHPDDIVIDLNTGKIEYRGPRTKEEKEEWDFLRRMKRKYDKEIPVLEKRAIKNPGDHGIQEDLLRLRELRSGIAKVISD